MRFTKKRLEMGEEAWAQYQVERKRKKSLKYNRRLGNFRSSQSRRNTKERLIDYKGGKCVRCGYDKKCPAAYHFHHRDPNTKSFTIANYTSNRRQMLAEVDKCDLVCANCHAEIHYEEQKLLVDEKKQILGL